MYGSFPKFWKYLPTKKDQFLLLLLLLLLFWFNFIVIPAIIITSDALSFLFALFVSNIL